MDEQFTPEFKAKVKGILDKPEPTSEELIADLQQIVNDLCDTCEKYEDALREVQGTTVMSGSIGAWRHCLEVADKALGGTWDLPNSSKLAAMKYEVERLQEELKASQEMVEKLRPAAILQAIRMGNFVILPDDKE